MNTTTSQLPTPGRVSTIVAGGAPGDALSVGNMFSKTATSHGPGGTSVGAAGSTVTRERVPFGRRQERAMLPMRCVRNPFAAQRMPT